MPSDPPAVTEIAVDRPLDLAGLRALMTCKVRPVLGGDNRRAVDAGADFVAAQAARPDALYGINTGFGKLANTRIDAADLAQLQRNLVVSHAAGTGPALPDPVVRLILALKIRSLAQGVSGVRWDVIEALAALARADVLPVVPERGSVGASGDLAPLAHLSAALLGLGEVRVAGDVLPAAVGLKRAGLAPLALAAKEGLALINGTQVSTALALAGLFAAEDAFAAALVAGALSVEAALASRVPFDARINAVRGRAGQIDVAAAFRALLADSEISRSHADCGKVQDPYSLRCQPQVMGAVLDLMREAARSLIGEANAVTDNPLVFAEAGEVLSGGNFHAQPVAFAADQLALAIAEIGGMSERRIALLNDNAISDLPPFLMAEPGLNSGFMIAHVTAAALTSRNKALAAPQSVDSLPTSANQEDHVSMATAAAARLAEMATNAADIAAIELLAAVQGLEFHRPLTSTPILESAVDAVRAHVPRLDRDRLMAPDVAAIGELVRGGGLSGYVAGLLPSDDAPADRGAPAVIVPRPWQAVAAVSRGTVPLVVSLPHSGTWLPEDVAARMTETGRAVPDTDWAVDRLYQFARELGASVIRAVPSRYVVDLNRPADDQPLYPGQVATGLVPRQSFDGRPLYRPGVEPDADEVAARRETYWRPYHDALAALIVESRARFGIAVVYDGHSIAAEVPRLFDGRLPDLNLGTNRGTAADPALIDAAAAACAAADGFTHVVDGRFTGGYITRAYGDPGRGVHALQMELAQDAYMTAPTVGGAAAYDVAKADRLAAVLRDVMAAAIAWALDRVD